MVTLDRHRICLEGTEENHKKIGKKYSLEYTEVPKLFFTLYQGPTGEATGAASAGAKAPKEQEGWG
jgi:hypothetical protein